MEPNPEPVTPISDEFLPPRKRKGQSATPRDSANEESDAPPGNPPMTTNSPPGVSIETPDGLIATFCGATGKDVQTARAFLTRFDWNVHAAVGASVDHDELVSGQSSSPSQFQTPNQNFSGHLDAQITELDETLKNAPPPMAPSQANVVENNQESRRPAQLRDDTHILPRNAWVDRICNENYVCPEEALYYLEGYNWDFGLAMEACRSKTLAPINDRTSSPGFLAREESPESPELSQLDIELISSFCKATGGATREVAIVYLKLCNWDVEQAVSIFGTGLSIPELLRSAELSHSHNQAASGLQIQSHLKVGQRGSSSSSVNTTDPPETDRSHKKAGKENLTLTIPGVESSQVEGETVEEDSTMETPSGSFDIEDRIIVGPRAGRSRNLAPVAYGTSSPGVSVGVESPESTLNLPEQPSQLNDELFYEFWKGTGGTTREEAIMYLKLCNWDVEQAVRYFWTGLPFPELSHSHNQAAHGLLTQSHLKEGEIGSSCSSFNSDPPETENITVAIPGVESSQVEGNAFEEDSTMETPSGSFDIEDRIIVGPRAGRCSTLPPVAYGTSSPGVSVREESPESTLNLPEQPSQLNNELISSFCEAAGGATREEARAYLNVCKWDVYQAVNFFLLGFPVEDVELLLALTMSMEDNTRPPLPESQYQSAPQSQLKEGETGSSSSSVNTDPPETERTLKTAGEENPTLAIPRMESSDVEGNAIEEDSALETPPGSFDIEDRITVGPRAASVTIWVDIVLAKGETLQIPFRSNQTVRDIHNAIDERRPDGKRGYYLQSHTSVECRDMNMTLQRIFTIDPTETETELYQLFQLYP